MEATARPAMNVREAFSLTDTIQIGSGIKAPEGVASYLELADMEEIPFFTIRNRQQTGLAYTNKDAKDALPWPFHIKDVGIRFHAAQSLLPTNNNSTDEDYAEKDAARLFEMEIPLHCGYVLKVSEDERLIGTVELAPPGTGFFGYTGGAYEQRIQCFSMGQPQLQNRFGFSSEIDVPKNTVVSVTLRPSAYARTLLRHMPGPSADLNLVDDPSGDAPKFQKFPKIALIRVTLNGAREVQQRGELHF